jgi:hypothetical protein
VDPRKGTPGNRQTGAGKQVGGVPDSHWPGPEHDGDTNTMHGREVSEMDATIGTPRTARRRGGRRAWVAIGRWIAEIVRQEPVEVHGFVQLVLALVVTMGLGLSDVQVGAILGVTASFLSLVTRTKVTPTINPRDKAGNQLVAKL